MQGPQVSLNKQRYQRNDSVVVFKTHDPFGGLSNMAAGFPLVINGVKIPTSEALYQACRFPHLPNVQQIIIGQRSPMTAKMKSKPYRSQTRPDWDSVRIQIMDWCLRVKLAQNWEKFSTLLLSTAEAPIVEQSRKDDFWGAKVQDESNLIGANVLGQLLMNLRQQCTIGNKETLTTVQPLSLPNFLLIRKPIGVINIRGYSSVVTPPKEGPSLFPEPAKHLPPPLKTTSAISYKRETVNVEQTSAEPDFSYPKRLIEVDLPIKRISAHARREKSIRHGHISTLHIWWARRPLAACRAVICAALWPDPADPLCPDTFRTAARQMMEKWANDHLKLSGEESSRNFVAIQKDPNSLKDSALLRRALLDFIADFANWDNATVRPYLDTSRALTQAAHEALGGAKGTRPLVVDPFAGGGSIPLEASRVGADAFASDLNPIPVLLNKVALEFIPKYGQRLANEVRKWGDWIKNEAKKELSEFYPKDNDEGSPIAYLWARTIQCEGPGCGAEVPLLGRSVIAHRKTGGFALVLKGEAKTKRIDVSLVEGSGVKHTKGTCKGFVVTCPRPDCGFSTPKKSVQRQLASQRGGADTSRLLAILIDGPKGRCYRLTSPRDVQAFQSAKAVLDKKIKKEHNGTMSLIPDEPIPGKTAHRAVGSQLPLYGFKTWGDLFSSRQKLAIMVLQQLARRVYGKLTENGDEDFARAVFLILALAVDKQADYSSSLCRWVSRGEFISGTLAGEKKLPMMADFAESNPVGNGSGSWSNQIDWLVRFIERESILVPQAGTVCQASANEHTLPSDAAAAMITDPPYYDSVPYADLSDFFYVWLKRTVHGIEDLSREALTPKDREMTVNHPKNQDEKARYEILLTGAFDTGREVTAPSGIAVIVFAHKSTAGWEALLEAIVKSGWIVTASWPIDTERSVRMNALETASLSSSVHIICRPRENPDGSVCKDNIGDWREMLQELPKRIHEWMPRLDAEGVVGADAIFACLGPALEIFSRYSRVEKASGEVITLKEYLEQVWAALAKEALTMVFRGADATGFEEDARLTAMWLWTLSTGWGKEDLDSRVTMALNKDPDEESDDESSSPKKAKLKGYFLEYDAARKIAQGLGAHLDELTSLIEVSGDTARLLPVAERTRALFGKDEAQAPTTAKRKKDEQLKLFFEDELQETEESCGWGQKGAPSLGHTALDRLHQAMILFAAGRGEALRRFLVDEGVGRDERFWRLAQALSALYPPGTDERRWVEGVQARKKGLGF